MRVRCYSDEDKIERKAHIHLESAAGKRVWWRDGNRMNENVYSKTQFDDPKEEKAGQTKMARTIGTIDAKLGKNNARDDDIVCWR